LVLQIIGGIIGAACSEFWVGADEFLANQPTPTVSQDRAFVCEFVFSLLIILSYLHNTTTEANRNNQYFGMAVGRAVSSAVCALRVCFAFSNILVLLLSVSCFSLALFPLPYHIPLLLTFSPLMGCSITRDVAFEGRSVHSVRSCHRDCSLCVVAGGVDCS
jgi:hypothetical protein